MEVEYEEIQEDSGHDSTWRWHAGDRVRGSQELLSHQCKKLSTERCFRDNDIDFPLGSP